MEIAALVVGGAKVGNELFREVTGIGVGDAGKKVIKKFFRGVRKVGHKTKEQLIDHASPQKIKDDMHNLLISSSQCSVATSNSCTKLSSTSSITSRTDSDESDTLCLLLQQLMSRDSRIKEVLCQDFADLPVKPSRYEIQKQLDRLNFMDYHCHIAVAGCSGTGKSSFINAIRGLKDNEPGAAPVGCVETTLEMKQYLPGYAEGKVVWYDVPGAGTKNIPREEYFRRQGLFVMDAIIVLWSDRLMDTDIDIMKQCALYNIPCYLLRSKCDVYIADTEVDLRQAIPRAAAEQNKEYLQERDRSIAEFRRKTMKVAELRMKEAFDTASSPAMRRDYTSSIFLVNSRSIYKMMTYYCLDAFGLDEFRFLERLSQGLIRTGRGSFR